MDATELLGYCAGLITTFAVVPQIRKAWKTRCADDISVFTVIMLICGLSLWTTYGALTGAWPIMVTNGIGTLLQISLLCLVFYERSWRTSGPRGRESAWRSGASEARDGRSEPTRMYSRRPPNARRTRDPDADDNAERH